MATYLANQSDLLRDFLEVSCVRKREDQMKRMTLLAKRPDLSTSDFRQYWAGPHGNLALEMNGISRYTQNRVEKTLWARNVIAPFNVDGIVELWFEGEEAMRQAQASTIGSTHIPADELNFLKGWSLCIVDEPQSTPHDLPVKVIAPLIIKSESTRELLESKVNEAVRSIEDQGDATVFFNWTISHARRERLWCEPLTPSGFAVFGFQSLKIAHDSFLKEGVISKSFDSLVEDGAAYLVNVLKMR